MGEPQTNETFDENRQEFPGLAEALQVGRVSRSALPNSIPKAGPAGTIDARWGPGFTGKRTVMTDTGPEIWVFEGGYLTGMYGADIEDNDSQNDI